MKHFTRLIIPFCLSLEVIDCYRNGICLVHYQCLVQVLDFYDRIKVDFFTVKTTPAKLYILYVYMPCVTRDITNIHETNLKNTQTQNNVCGSHKVLSHMGFEPTTFSPVKSGVVNTSITKPTV